MNKQEYIQKVNLLKKYAKAYYTDDDPLISDEVYDKLYKEIELIEKDNPSWIIKDSPPKG